jgi:DEAD/DEAH box helicase domain-containing protein
MTAQVRSPHSERPVIYLWEAVPGGVGMAPRLYARTDELLEGALDLVRECECASGCPGCVGPHVESSLDVRALSRSLLERLVSSQPLPAVA